MDTITRKIIETVKLTIMSSLLSSGERIRPSPPKVGIDFLKIIVYNPSITTIEKIIL
jgi:hypothetical protein